MPDTDPLAVKLAAFLECAESEFENFAVEAPPRLRWSCQDVPVLVAALEAVLKRHTPEPSWGYLGEAQCQDDGQSWPCATYEVIARELTKEAGR